MTMMGVDDGVPPALTISQRLVSADGRPEAAHEKWRREYAIAMLPSSTPV
jgi:hypothetical protein